MTIVYSIALAIICLVSFSNLPKVNVSNADKIFHTTTYVMLACLWYHTFFFHFKNSQSKSIIKSVFLAIVFGMIIEVLQGVFTTTRHADIMDVIANTIGVLMFVVFISIKNRITVKKL